MLKNNHGVTLSILVVTIIVIFIIGGITISATSSLLIDTKAKNALSNMYLIKGKMETIYEEHQFSGKDLKFAGTDNPNISTKVSNISTLSQYGISSDGLPASETTDNYWYTWNKNTLEELGFDTSMLPKENSEYIVYYVTEEIIYTTGVKIDSGEKLYTFNNISNYVRGTSE